MKNQRKPNGWQRVLMVVQTGEVFTKDMLQELLKDKKIHMYRMSNYMLDIKLFAGGIVRPTKEGRNVVGYQICNPETVQKYLRDKGFIKAKAVKVKAPTNVVEKLEDLQATPVQVVVEQVTQ